MSHSKKTHDLIRENEQSVKKSQKHEANLQKNTTLFFQIGLIVCLLSVYGLLEMKFESELPKDYGDIPAIDISDEIAIENFKVLDKKPDMPEAPKEPKEPEVPENFKDPKVVDNDSDDKESDKITTPDEEKSSSEDLDVGAVNVVDAPTDDAPVDFIRVEQVPIYPGCENEKDNEGRRKCMSDKITKLIQKKFDTNLGSELGLSGKQVIRTRFTIDKNGKVNDVKVRGPHSDLEKEAERVIDFIPEMTPGKQRDRNVDVIYDLPIIFQVQD
ncbi:energy transducer TonB [Aestuariibaculum suncheonense]|uniref:Energy transducer TonB n=1 Tax=Aestuariibaculum suncheonense TaxID=1028745 RepID=A0A8J6QLC2_9FLAO|nr:energy transducer TonB [Aestuariibaculum suncheonense]MBD0836667.1 energy transducer TonB [Aestuariibaculum suncheonense]